MPDNEGFVHDLLLPDSNTRRFHAGDACQWLPPVPEDEVEPVAAAMLAAHRATIHAPGARPRGRFGLDEDGNPIETSYLGVGVDPETGAVYALDAEGNRIGEPEPIPARTSRETGPPKAQDTPRQAAAPRTAGSKE